MTQPAPTSRENLLRMAVAQPLMQWSGADNTAAVVQGIARAAAAGARLCVFPELALTGYHRRIAQEAQPPLVAASLQTVAAACARHGVAVALGLPSFDAEGRIFNSLLLLDAQGRSVARIDKTGLTEPEATFFARGDARPAAALCGLRCSAVLCREVEDLEAVCMQFEGQHPELIFWPGLMSPEQGVEHLDPPRHVQQAQQMAQRLGAFIVQANWPNSVNYPEKSAFTGASAVISPGGELLFRLPQAQAGLAVFELGSRHFEWLAP